MVSVGTNTDLKGLLHCHIPKFSPCHPIIPSQYVMGWKMEFKFREQIAKSVQQAGIPNSLTEKSLFQGNKERLCHGEDRRKIQEKIQYQDTSKFQCPPRHSHLYKYNSSLISQRDLLA
ncbi:sperm-associated microtubule inner protein 10 [Latimeria chalumnae]|uniref:sperm-associated microtubule inner protein 10 n=1 Tax=Latimeria chalumnae TaxID=7897 RepID=UPI0003C1190B|nr:PREDICTED: testis-expressed sequence 43 protein [Latimeria chalumnae]|eukprot:XP_006002780.1 PREDICTED: testis-expressed sequence 43 protein [Latimeria chalumnae]